MTYHPDSVLVEKVAKARWKMRGGIITAWESIPPAWRAVEIEEARRYLSVACPLVAGVIADRLDEVGLVAVPGPGAFVRHEFGGEA